MLFRSQRKLGPISTSAPPSQRPTVIPRRRPGDPATRCPDRTLRLGGRVKPGHDELRNRQPQKLRQRRFSPLFLPLARTQNPQHSRASPPFPTTRIAPTYARPFLPGVFSPRCRHLPQLTRRGGDDRDGGGRRTLQVRLAARHPTGCPTAQTRNPIAESAGCLITPTVRRRLALSVRGVPFTAASHTPGPQGRRTPSAATNSGAPALV